MNHDPNHSHPTQTPLTVPMWIIALALVLIFLGGVYFDHHSGWFNAQVYGPYANGEQLALYQPMSGEAAKIAHGKVVYENVCGTCHGPDGLGKPGQAPPLAGSDLVIKGAKRLTEIPLLGLNGQVTVKGQAWNLDMAAMGAQLSDADLAGVLSYIRSSWGNHAEEVTADDVKSVRAAIAGHDKLHGETELNTIAE